MSTVRVGSTNKYASNWENIFAGKSSAKKKTASKPAAKATAKKKKAKKK